MNKVLKNERLLLLLLGAGMFTHIVDFMIIMPLGPQLERLIGVNTHQFSLLVASYSITAGVFGFLSAFLIDRYDRKVALITTYLGFSIGTLACGFASSYEYLFLARALAGGFGGILGGLTLSIVSDLVPLERRAASIGSIMASFGVASVVGVPLGLLLANRFTWNTPFLCLGILGLTIALLVFMFMPSIKGHIKEVPENPISILHKVFGSKNARLGLTFISVLMLGHFTIIPFIAKYMVGNVGLTEGELTYIYLVGGISVMIFSPIIGKLADRYGRLRIFTIFGSLVIIPILTITNMSPIPLWMVLCVAAIFFIFSNGRIVPSTTMETAVIKPENRGSYMGIRAAVQQLTAGMAAYIGGLMMPETPSLFSENASALTNYPMVGFVAVGFTLLSLLVARKLHVEHEAN